MSIEQQSNEKYSDLADRLEALERQANDGRGIEHVRWIIDDLRRGDVETAKTNYRNQSDKFGNYPEIKQLLKDAGLMEE